MTTQTTKPVKVQTIDINAKEWFDKVNGNSYFAGYVTINYGHPDAQNINMPFQYGYGDSYQYAAMTLLKEKGFTEAKYMHDLRDLNIIVRYNIQRGCKKRELMEY
jgi:hypothetical protein